MSHPVIPIQASLYLYLLEIGDCLYLLEIKIEDYLNLLEKMERNISFKISLTAIYFLRFSNLSIFLTIDFQTENMAEKSTHHL